jgi:predicted Zn finger-like uncharacterized protein
MIVKCEQCQTRFKIPDDKVTEKGVKVRCTKCQHTFRVFATPPPAAPADPFERFGPSIPPPPGNEETRPGVFALGVEASRSPDVGGPLQPSFAAQASTPSGVFDAPTRVAKMPPPPPGKRPLTDPGPAPFDFDAMKPPAPAANPFDFSRGAAKASSFEPQPFDFSGLAPPETTVKAQMPGPPKAAPSQFEPQPFDFSALAPPPEPTVKAQMPGPPKAPAPSQFEPQPFDFSSLDVGGPPPPPPAPAARVQPPAPPPSHFEPQPFDFSSVDAGQPPPPPQRPSAPKTAPPPPKPARQSSPPPPPPPKPARPSSPPPAARTVEDLGQMDFGAPPPAPSASAAPTQLEVPKAADLLADIPFSDDHLSVDVDDGMRAEPGARGALFDMAEPDAASQPVNQLAAAQDDVAVAKISLKKVTAEQLAAEQAQPKESRTGTESSRSRRPRGVVAMVWNVLSLALLLVVIGAVAAVVVNDGKIDLNQSYLKVKAMFSAPRELVAFDISNGLYDTRAGRPVFYVRGEIKNRGKKSGRVKVKAEILDGEDLIRAAEGYAGATPSPEELYGVATADDLASLSARLAPAAQQLAPGAEAPFLVAFYEYPPDLKDFRVRVTVSPDDGKTAAR